jgi:hypothetical protein
LNWRFSKPSNQVLDGSDETAGEMSGEGVLIMGVILQLINALGN